MINLKIAGAVALLAITPILANSSADARMGGGGHGGGGMGGGGGRGGGAAFGGGGGGGFRGGGAAFAGGGFRGGGAVFNGGGANFAGRNAMASGRNFAAPAVNLGGAAPSVGPRFNGGQRVANNWSGRNWNGNWNGRRWIGPGLGFAAGLALGAPYGYGYYDDPYSYGGDYADAYYGDNSFAYYDGAAAPDVVYGSTQTGGDSTAFCQQQYKSYNAATGTYLGYDGARHPCP
jgi:hypothetical protein